MKYIFSVVAVMLAGVASAQVAPVGNTYVELGTTFEAETSLAIGTGFGFGVGSAFGELSGSTDGNFQARTYSNLDLGNFTFTPGVNYDWGGDNGNLVGFGEDNEWGQLSTDIEVKLAPGIVGGEYAFVNGGTDIDGLSLDWNGGAVGAGYKLDLADNVYLDGRVSWEYDDEFNGSKPQYTAGFGLKF